MLSLKNIVKNRTLDFYMCRTKRYNRGKRQTAYIICTFRNKGLDSLPQFGYTKI